MSNTPLHRQSIVSLAQQIRQRELSPVKLTQHYLERIQALDGALNAFRLVRADKALADAKAAEENLRSGTDLGVLHGIPYAAKDLFDVAGLPTSAGSHLLEDNIASQDAEVVSKLSQAGMVLLGKTNTVQFAYGGVGLNHNQGTPHNPWHKIHHLPGGSSSGSGVAVAAGMAPMALGSDTGGSVRIPASLCGVVGLKTTVGQVSTAGVYPLSQTLDSVGPLARTVADAAHIYQCIRRTDGDPDTARGAQDVVSGLNAGVKGLRLAFAEAAFWEDVNPKVERTVRACAGVFKGLGAKVSSVEFPEAADALRLNPRGLVLAAEAYTNNRKWVDDHFDELDPIVANRLIMGKEVSAFEYLQCLEDWRGLRASAIASLQDVDALLVPATINPALPLSEVDINSDKYARYNMAYLRNTVIGNVLNLCGLVVPCGFTEKGLPIGLMIYGKPFAEDMVLRVGHAFEQATDWHARTPDLSYVARST